MPVTSFEEIPLSRQQSLEPLSLTLKYNALGEQDDDVVRQFSKLFTAGARVTAWGVLHRQNIEIEPVGAGHYLVTVPYGPRPGKNAGDMTFNFDSTGGTLNITAAKQHINDYPPTGAGGALNPYKGAIGVKQSTGECDGAEIVVPAMKFGYQFRHPEGVVDELMAIKLGRATGKTNAVKWRVFEPGEALFMGATGSDGRNAEADITYHIAASENATGLTIGQILNIDKAGWDYMWVGFKTVNAQIPGGGKINAVIPERVFVERVYDPVDFSDVFGWE